MIVAQSRGSSTKVKCSRYLDRSLIATLRAIDDSFLDVDLFEFDDDRVLSWRQNWREMKGTSSINLPAASRHLAPMLAIMVTLGYKRPCNA